MSELENKISDLEEFTRTPGKRDEYLESELRKLKTMVEVSNWEMSYCIKLFGFCILFLMI